MLCEIKKELKRQYNLDINDAQMYVNGKPGFFIIYCDKAKYVLKSLNKELNLQQVMKIKKACTAVRNYGIKTPQFINTNMGAPYFHLKNNKYVLYLWIEGQILEYNKVSIKQLLELANKYADVVSALSTLPKEQKKQGYKWNVNMLKRHIIEAESIKKKLLDYEMLEILDWKIAEMNRLSSYSNNYLNNMTWANSHGDYYISQALFDELGKMTGLIDFDSFSCQPLAFELIRCFYSALPFETDEKQMKIFAEYLFTFIKRIPLTHEDFYYMHYLFSYKIITSLYWFVIFLENPLNQTIKNEAIKYSNLAMQILNNQQILREGIWEFLKDRMMSIGED